MGKSINAFAKEMSVLLPQLHKEILTGQARIIKTFDITFPQIVILHFLEERGKCKMTDIAAFLTVTTSAATGIVDRMVKSKLLKRIRAAADRRVINIQLTPKGKKIIVNFLKQRRKMMINIFRHFNSTERELYLKLVKKIYNSITKGKR